MKRALRLGLVLHALLGGACMPPIHISTAFSSRFGDNDRARLERVLSRLPSDGAARPSNATGSALMVAVVQGEQRAVAAYDIAARRALWTRPMAASSTPEILGDAVVVEVGHHTAILDLRTGEERGRVEHTGLDLAGADRDGETIVLSLSSGLAGGGGRRAGRVIAVSASGGSERWAHDLGGLVGRPACRGGMAFVPWDRQSIAVLDLSNGHEVARLRSTDDVIAWVWAAPSGVFYGSGRGIYRLTADSSAGTRAGSAFLANPLEGVPGDPQLHRDAFVNTTGTRTAREKIRFAFRPRAGADRGRVALQHDAVFLSYYRDLLAVDAATGAVRWAQRLEDDVEAMQVTEAGLVVVSGDGKVRAVDPATGAVSLVAELGASVGAIALDVEGMALPGGGTAPEGSVRDQLTALVRDADNRLVPFRSFLAGVLARREEEEATHDLLDLYAQRSIPVQLKQSIATALQTRRTGSRYLVEALQSHYDYLEGRQAPPLQVIAPTLVAMNARDAVPGLLSHLLDHETPQASLPAVVNAVATLGEASVVPALQRWMQLYRSDSAFRGNDNAAALNAAAEGIFRHGDAAAREWLQGVQRDATVNSVLRAHIDGLFHRAASDERNRATAASESERQAQLQAEVNRVHEAQDAVPNTLTDQAIDEVWNAHLDDVRECAQGAVTRNATLNQIRVVVTLRSEMPRGLLDRTPPAMTAGAEGQPRHRTTTDEAMAWTRTQLEAIAAQRARVRLTTYSPNDPQLRQCMDRVLTTLEFPVFREARQEFRRVIDTRAGRAAEGGEARINGMGVDGEGRELPWWLVSAPTLAVENPAPAAPATGTRPPTAAQGAGTPRPGTPTGPGNPPTQGGQNPPQQGPPQQGTTQQRPWWEE